MIRQLTLTCFRKVEQATMQFGPGLNVIRGQNEASKSTRLEALGYSLFGTRALRNSLEETVTWNRPVKDLKVEAELVLPEGVFRFSRSKAGAEVFKDGAQSPYITGQQEVSAFAAKLLGADVNAAAQLMLAGQGSLRGVLSDGPKAASAMIEGLSDLDLIERLIEAAQHKLQLGSTAVTEERLKNAEAQRAALPVVQAPDQAALDAATSALAANLVEARAAVDVAVKAHNDASLAFTKEDSKQRQRERLNQDIEKLGVQVQDLSTKREQASIAASAPIPNVAAIEARLAAAEDHSARSDAYRAFCALPASPVPGGGAWGLRSEHGAEKAEFLRREKQNQKDYAEVQAEIKVLTAWAAPPACPNCGYLPADVVEKQSKVANDLALAKQHASDIEHADGLNDTEIRAYQVVEDYDRDLATKLRRISSYVVIDDSVIPMLATWKGEVPTGETPNVLALRQEVAAAKARAAEVTKAQGQVETYDQVLADTNLRLDKLREEVEALACLPLDEFNALNHAFIRAGAQKYDAECAVAAIEGEIQRLKAEFDAAQKAWQDAQNKVQVLDAQIADLKADIEAIGFNNSLVKKIRSARPIIANKLWSMVLSCVSTLFSQMRGETSIVTKEKDGFLVNGRPVESLSGSTLDVLGLAIRCALIKTFIPQCPFLVLDEPSAACDANRSAALIGFVAASGFQQVIVVTHEDTSEALAANLIQL